MSKKAIVIGATGLVGSELIKLLCDNETISQVVVLARRPIAIKHAKIISHIIDFENLAANKQLFNGDMLFSCLGTTKKQAKTISAQRRVDLDYQLLAAKMAASNNVSHYLLVSSSGANSGSLSPYLKMKGELEEHVKQLPFQKISILQPSLLTGVRHTSRPLEDLGTKILPFLCKLPWLKRYTPITGKQVAEKLVHICQTQTENIATYSLDELFNV